VLPQLQRAPLQDASVPKKKKKKKHRFVVHCSCLPQLHPPLHPYLPLLGVMTALAV
jgi:hypothetical protein